MIEADFAFFNNKRFCIGSVGNFLFDIQKIKHRFNICQTLANFAINRADKIKRYRKLHEQRIDKDKISKRLRAMHDFICRHQHHHRHAGTEYNRLPEIEPSQ